MEPIIALAEDTEANASQSPVFQSNVSAAADVLSQQTGTNQVYSIMVYYTEVKPSIGLCLFDTSDAFICFKGYESTFTECSVALPMQVSAMIAKINEGYINSDINVRAELFCLEKVKEGFQEFTDSRDQLDHFRTFQGRFLSYNISLSYSSSFYRCEHDVENRRHVTAAHQGIYWLGMWQGLLLRHQ